MNVFASIAKIPELRKRVLFTIGMLAVYRIGVFLTTPGVNRAVLQDKVQGQGGLLGMVNLFSGGAFEQMSIFALNIMPYVTASIMLSLLSAVVPQLAELRKEGAAGQRKINQYTRYGTIVLSIVQGIGIAFWLEAQNGTASSSLGGSIGDVVPNAGWGFRFMTVLSLTTGTAFLMWLGEQITEKGIGNGISIIIFAGIVANLPAALQSIWRDFDAGRMQPLDILAIAFIALATTAFICFFERAQRRIPTMHPRRAGGGAQLSAEQRFLPLRVNQAGVIPPIFTTSIFTFPLMLAGYGLPGMNWVNAHLQPTGPNQWIYLSVFAAVTIFFTFFYVALTVDPVQYAENLENSGAYVPNVKPGRETADYLDRVITRVTVAGALYITIVCTVPTLLQGGFNVAFYLGGTSLMIVVGVALDVAQHIQDNMITRHYEGSTNEPTPSLRGRD